jgi:hypothetical protein
MIGDHYGPATGRATVLVRAVDAILGTHRSGKHLDQLNEFWGGSASGSGLGTDWRADIDPILRSYQGAEEGNYSVHRETFPRMRGSTTRASYAVRGVPGLGRDAPVAGEGPRESDGTARWPSTRSPMATDT